MTEFLDLQTKASTLLLLSTALGLPGVAYAETGQAADVDADEIVVTATKRETELQETPLALTALDSRALERSGVTDLVKLDTQVPSMFVAGDDGFGSNSVSIRGIGSLALGNGADDAVGIYIDGVYQGRPYGNVFEFVDVDRIEVLRGPQGTLYGRNATGGAINIITKTPGREFTGYIDAERASFNGSRIQGYLMAPVTETLAVKFAGGYHYERGWAFNPTTDEHLYGDKNFYTDFALSWTPSSDTSVVLKSYYGQTHSTYAYKNVRDGLPLDVIPANLPNFDKRDYYGGSLTIAHKFADMELTSITGYAHGASVGSVDPDGGPQSLVEFRSDFGFEAASEELRLSSSGAGRFNWIVGGLAYFESSDAIVPLGLPPISFGFVFADKTKTHAYSAFAEGSYRFTDKLTLTAGARYSYETKHWGNCIGFYTDFDVDFDPRVCVGQLIPDKKKSRVVTPRFVLDFKANDAVMLYASATRGFRSGGWNFTDDTIPNAKNGFSPEYVWSYEAGLKSDLFDRKLRFNLAAFHADYSKLIVRVFEPVTQLLQTRNAGAAQIDGVELEATVKPLAGLEFSAVASWLDAKYTKFTFTQTNGEVVDYKGNRLNRAPEWQINLGAQYRADLGESGSLTARAEYRYVSAYFNSETNREIEGSDPFHIVNLRLGYEAQGGWGVRAFVENVTDKQYRTYTFTGNDGSQPATISSPRVWGVSAHYRW